jgi:hypothetical protein
MTMARQQAPASPEGAAAKISGDEQCRPAGRAASCNARGPLCMRKQSKGPLREIVDVTRPAYGLFDKQKVALSCGHTVLASSGAIYRARCSKCVRRLTDIGSKRD